MNRHTIVLAEEKVSIMRLIERAMEKKPMGQERIGAVVQAADEAALFEALSTGVEPIVLLSTTFLQDKTHETLISAIVASFPSVKIITLTHKYGDRSSLAYGAYESIDKPIRNPVLWEILDRTIVASDTQVTAPEKPKKPAVVLPKPVAALPKAPEVKRETPISPVPVTTPSKSTVLFDSNEDDDDDEDDLFGTTSVAIQPPAVTQPASLFVDDEEEEDEIVGIPLPELSPMDEEPVEEPEELEFSFEVVPEDEKPEEMEALEPVSDGLRPENVITDVAPVVEFDIPQHTEPEEIPAEPWQVETEDEPEEAFSFDLSETQEEEPEEEFEEPLAEPENEMEPPVTEAKDVHETTSLDGVGEEEGTVEPTRQALEQIGEINPESPIYNELSEWTLANEGFMTKNGEFVSLVPPRMPKGKSAQQANRVQRTASAKPTVGSNGADTDGFFGSVRNIFKKK